MKPFILLLFSYCLTTRAIAQDIIVKNDKTEIKAKIEEITETTIKYKKFEMLDGPIYNLNIADAFMIIYKNGIKEYMKVSTPGTQSQPQNTSQNTPQAAPQAISQNSQQNMIQNNPRQNDTGNHPQIIKNGGKIEIEGERLRTHSDIKNTYLKYGYKDLADRHKETQTITYVAAGVGLLGLGLHLGTGNYLFSIGGGVFALTASFVCSGIQKSGYRTFNQRAVKISQNGRIGMTPIIGYSPVTNTSQIGVSIGF